MNWNNEARLRKLKKGKADILTFDLYTFLEEVYRVTENILIIFSWKIS